MGCPGALNAEARAVQLPLLSLGLIACVAGVVISMILPVSWVRRAPLLMG